MPRDRLGETGRTYAVQGDMRRAVDYFRQALVLAKELGGADEIRRWNNNLAGALAYLGQWDEAIAEYERILKINPNYPLAQYHLAQAYERKGKPAQARTAYERFLQIWKNADSDIPEVVKAKARTANQPSAP